MDQGQREGMYPPPPGASHVLGVEFSGIVHELGSGVTKWNLGDEVYGLVGGVWTWARSMTKWSYNLFTRVHTPTMLYVIKVYFSRSPPICPGWRPQASPKTTLQVCTAIRCPADGTYVGIKGPNHTRPASSLSSTSQIWRNQER